MESNSRPIESYLPHIALAIAFFGFFGSLYFSEIARYDPCLLCWWQRVCLYPLIPTLAVGITKQDKFVYRYALPLAAIGFFIAFYHTAIYYIANFSSKNPLTPCAITGPSCTTPYIQWFGFISIPLLSLLAFGGIVLLLMWHRSYIRKIN